jgi:hypothetical protein
MKKNKYLISTEKALFKYLSKSFSAESKSPEPKPEPNSTPIQLSFEFKEQLVFKNKKSIRKNKAS